MGLAIRKAKRLALGMALSKSEAKKSAEDAAAEEERKCLAAEAAGEGGKLDEGASSGNMVQNLDAEAVRQLRMGLEWLFLIRGYTGSYHIIGWIVLYCRLDRIISYWLDQETLAFMR